MRPLPILVLVMLFAMAGTAAMAQSIAPACPAPVTTCPQPVVACPQPAAACPQVCPPTAAACPTPVTCPLPELRFGAGPVSSITGLTCGSFDQAFITSMYQQHSTVIALATQGISQTSDKDLQNLAGKIRYERTKMNDQLVVMARRTFGEIPVDYNQTQCFLGQLNGLAPEAYNEQFAKAMIGLLQQEQQAAQAGMANATIPRLRDQAGIVARSSQNEIAALQRWLASHPSVCAAPCVATPVCPAPSGAGPACPAPPVCPAPLTCPAPPACQMGPLCPAPAAPVTCP